MTRQLNRYLLRPLSLLLAITLLFGLYVPIHAADNGVPEGQQQEEVVLQQEGQELPSGQADLQPLDDQGGPELLAATFGSQQEMIDNITPSLTLIAGPGQEQQLSGEPLGAQLSIMWQLLEGRETLDKVEVTVKSNGLQISKPIGTVVEYASYEQGELDGGGDDPYTLHITLTDIANIIGGTRSIPISTVFPNGVTEDGAPGAVYISEISAGGFTYSPEKSEFHADAFFGSGKAVFTGQSKWKYEPKSNLDFYSTIYAEAGNKWSYATDRLTPTTYTLDRGTEYPINYVVEPTLGTYGFKVKVDNSYFESATASKAGEMYTTALRPAAIIEMTSSKIKLRAGDLVVTDGSGNPISSASVTEIAGGGNKFLVTWDVTVDGTKARQSESFQIRVKSFVFTADVGADDELLDSQNTITLTPVRLGEADATDGYSVAINGEKFKIVDGTVQTIKIKKNYKLTDKKPDGDDIHVKVSKQSDAPTLSDDTLAPKKHVLFTLGIENKTKRSTLYNVTFTEVAGVSYNPDAIKPVAVTNGNVAGKLVIHSTNGKLETALTVDQSVTLTNAHVYGSDTLTDIKSIQLVYAEVTSPDTLTPKIQFELVSPAAFVNNKTSNTVGLGYEAYKPDSGSAPYIGYDKDGNFQKAGYTISDTKKVDFSAKAEVTYKKSDYTFTHGKTISNTTPHPGKNDAARYFKGDTVEYTLEIEYPADSTENAPIGFIYIKDTLAAGLSMDNPTDVTVKVYNANGSSAAPLDSKGDPATGTPGVTEEGKTFLKYTVSVATTATGFELWLKGTFNKGDSIEIIYDATITADSGKTAHNKFSYAMFPVGGTGVPGSGGTIPPTDITYNGNGENKVTVSEEVVFAGIKKTRTSAGSIPTTGAANVGTVAEGDRLVSFSIEVTVKNSDLLATQPVLIDQLPAGFTLVNSPGSLNDMELKVNGNLYAGTVVENSEGVFLYVELPAMDGVTKHTHTVTFNALAPTTITFADGATTAELTNYAFFEPNALAVDNVAGDGKGLLGRFTLIKGSEVNYADYIKNELARNTVSEKITGVDLEGLGAIADGRSFLYDYAIVSFTRDLPVLELTKQAYAKNTYADADKLTAPLYPGDIVYYKAVLTNTGKKALELDSIVDVLPRGQFLDRDSLSLALVKNPGATAITTYTLKTGDSLDGDTAALKHNRRMEITLGSKLSLGENESLTITYAATVSGREVLEGLLGTTYENTIAVYPANPFRAANDLLDAYPAAGVDSDYRLQATGTHLDKYVKAEAEVDYNLIRIKPEIIKYNYYNGAENTSSYQVSDSGVSVTWRIAVRNTAGENESTFEDIENYRIYDILPPEVVMTAEQQADFNRRQLERPEAERFALEQVITYGRNTILVFKGPALKRGTEAQNYEAAPLTFDFDTHVPVGAAIGASDTGMTNQSFLFPGTEYYMDQADLLLDQFYDKGIEDIRTPNTHLVPVGQPGVNANNKITFSTLIGARAIKAVTNAANTTAISGEREIPVNRLEQVTYTYTLENTSRNDISYQRFAVIDVLPRAGDSFVYYSGSRSSEWAPVMSQNPGFTLNIGSAAVADYKIYYSTTVKSAQDKDWELDPADTDWTLYEQASWGALSPEQRAAVTAFRVLVNEKLEKSKTFTLTWKMDVPDSLEGAPKDKIAWNSAAFGVWAQFGLEVLRFNAEPDKVGIVPPGESDLDLWIRKVLVNQRSARTRDFEVALERRLADGSWETVLLSPKSENGSIVPDVYVEDAAEGAGTITISVPASNTNPASHDVLVKGLPEATYRITETKPTPGFVKDPVYSALIDGQKVTVTDGGTEKDATELYLNKYDTKPTLVVTNTASTGGGITPGPDPTEPTTTAPTEEPSSSTGGEDSSEPSEPSGSSEPSDPSEPTDPGETTAPTTPITPPPVPTAPGNTLEPSENGYIEFDENGTPLGEWTYDEELDEWIFDEFPPLGNLPLTGYLAQNNRWLYLVLFSVLALTTLLGAQFLSERNYRKGRRSK